jgi:hypothetical protein
LDQKPASAWRDSSDLRRSALPGRSKKVSQLEDAVLQPGEPLGQIGHGRFSHWMCLEK